jgi:hypothetical protein
MFVDDNPGATLDDILAHHGVRGMKWGVRRGKATTGVSRSRGAVLDRNARREQTFQNFKNASTKQGPSTVGARVGNKVNHLTMGRKLTVKYYDAHLHALHAQDERLKTGNLKLRDHLATVGTAPLSRVISVRPKNQLAPTS